MTLTRKIKLKAPGGGSGPFKRFYEDSSMTNPAVQDRSLHITPEGSNHRIQYSLGGWSTPDDDQDPGVRLLRQDATAEQKLQWINAYAQPSIYSESARQHSQTTYISQASGSQAYNSLPRLLSQLRETSINRVLLSENVRDYLRMVSIDTATYNPETEQTTVSVSSFYQDLFRTAPDGVVMRHTMEIIQKVRVAGESITPINIQEYIYQAKRKILSMIENRVQGQPLTKAVALSVLTPRYLAEDRSLSPLVLLDDPSWRVWLATGGHITTEEVDRIWSETYLAALVWPRIPVWMDESLAAAQTQANQLNSDRQGIQRLQEIDISSVADSLDYLVPKLFISPAQLGQPVLENMQDSRIALFNAIRNLIGKEELVRLVFQGQPVSSCPYSSFDVQVSTPFVTRREIYPLLELGNGVVQRSTGAKIDPQYLLYNKHYEDAISGSFVTEGILPNFYIYNLYASSYRDDRGLRKTDAWEGSRSSNHQIEGHYQDQLSLGGIISETDLPTSGQGSVDYLHTYSREVSSPALSDRRKSFLEAASKSLIFPATDGNMLWNLRGEHTGLPMHIETSFTPENIGPVGEVIKNSGVSTTLLESLRTQEPISDIKYDTSTDLVMGLLFGTPESKYVSHVPFGERSYNTYDIFRSLDFGKSGETITSLVVTEKGLEPVTGMGLTNDQVSEVDRAKRQIRSLLPWQTPDYPDLLRSGTSLSSEALGYVLRKYDTDGNILQEIMFGNTGDLQVLSYIDTQVKYNTNYTYELNEFRMVYVPRYDLFMADAILPQILSTYPDYPSIVANQANLVDSDMNPYYDIFTSEKSEGLIVEVPIYGSAYDVPNFEDVAGSVEYPTAKIMDYPPTTPEMQILPLLSNYRQIKINIQQNTGDYIGKSSLDVVSLPETLVRHTELYDYQSQFEYYILKPGKLGFRNDGIDEVATARLYRTKNIINNVSEYSELYRSFGIDGSETLTMTIDPALSSEDSVLSLDIVDTIEPNEYYYYTCVVEDVHGNPSNPSPIYRVRLVYEKGLYIPEIEVYNFTPINNQRPTRKFARFMQIQASDIQTFPFVDIDENGASVGTKNLAERTDSGIIGQEFIVRLTSKDTGRKFDVKLSFNEKLTEKFIESDDPDE